MKLEISDCRYKKTPTGHPKMTPKGPFKYEFDGLLDTSFSAGKRRFEETSQMGGVGAG